MLHKSPIEQGNYPFTLLYLADTFILSRMHNVFMTTITCNAQFPNARLTQSPLARRDPSRSHELLESWTKPQKVKEPNCTCTLSNLRDPLFCFLIRYIPFPNPFRGCLIFGRRLSRLVQSAPRPPERSAEAPSTRKSIKLPPTSDLLHKSPRLLPSRRFPISPLGYTCCGLCSQISPSRSHPTTFQTHETRS